MINPKIREEYGDNGERILNGFCSLITAQERDSIYAVGHNSLSKVDGAVLELASDRKDLVDSINDKIMDYMFSIDGNTITLCYEYKGEGIKVWLTSK